MSMKNESIIRILRIEGRIPDESEVLLQACNDARAFHCLTCGGFMFYRQHRVVAIVQDDMSQVLLSPPLTVQCHKCGDIYRLRVM